MGRPVVWVLLTSLLLAPLAASEQEAVRHSLVQFLRTLSANDTRVERDLRWSAATDPCVAPGWKGITCNEETNSTKRILLSNLSLRGSIDAGLLCTPPSLVYVDLSGNSLAGGIPPEISNCTQLTHLFLAGNRLSGTLPSSLAGLNNLKKLDISGNDLSGELPNVARVSGLVAFLAQDNRLNGSIPQLQFANLRQFNVSNNNFSGAVPDGAAAFFNLSSFLGNPGLCGGLQVPACPLPPAVPSQDGKHNHPYFKNKVVMYLGYVLLAIAILVFATYVLVVAQKKRKKTKEEEGIDAINRKDKGVKKVSADQNSAAKASTRSDYSIQSSTEMSTTMSSSLVVLRNTREGKELRFQDLLSAPAELLGRGHHGSLYKVVCEDGTALAVKRIKDWTVGAEEFRRRMGKVDQVRHPGVLPALAFYSSDQEKLVVYEYQPNGCLFKLLQGSQNGQALDWGSRLGVAASICDALAFMHLQLHRDGIAHGNIKSSNILLDPHLYPCISEYGLTAAAAAHDQSDHSDESRPAHDPFATDVYGFGVVVLELLTGKVVGSSGFDLARWVNSVVREEWTGEVFDAALVGEGGACEERMVRLLQVALKCISPSPDTRPGMDLVAAMIAGIKLEEDRSVVSSETSDSR